MIRLSAALSCAVLVVAALSPAQAQDARMSFFVTSEGMGKGADLGGLAGADAHCTKLAQAAVPGNNKTWRAYLSTKTVNAADRIGKGPWHNAKGELIAQDVASLHNGASNLTKQTAISEKGMVIKGRGDDVNMHDILTGTKPDGTAAPETCNDWTSSGEGAAIVGHHDRIGLRDDAPSKSWNSSHPSRGCSQDQLKASGGAGLLYCFAAN
jgi:hypothetical protein